MPANQVAKVSQAMEADLDVLEEDIGSQRTVWLRLGHFCRGDVHALKVIPGCAVWLHCFGQRCQEVAHVHATKAVPPANCHSEQIYLHTIQRFAL